MRVEQAIFTSARSTTVQGYHLVGRSPGIDSPLAQTLTRWGPSHGSLAGPAPDADSFNFHPAGDGWVALSRTVYGAPEYSARGGLQLVTSFLVLRHEQLAGYDYNPVLLARVALALGHLRLRPVNPVRLPAVELPDRPICGPTISSDRAGWAGSMERLWHLSKSCERVAVGGASDPLGLAADLISRVPGHQRVELSFTTGLKPTLSRPFRLHFVCSADAALRRLLTTQGIAFFSASDAASIHPA